MRHVGKLILVSISLSLIGLAACRSSRPDTSEPTEEEAFTLDPQGESGPASQPVAEPSAQQPGAQQPGAQQPGEQQPEATTPTASAQDPLSQRARELSLAEQRKSFLVEQHLAVAQDLVDRMRLEDAREELGRALNLAPDNLEVKRKLSEVQALLGETAGTVDTVTRQLSDSYALRVQQMKAEAEDGLRKAKLMLARGDYDGAISELSLTLNHIRWAPYSVDWKGIDEEAASLLERSKADREVHEEERLRAAQRDAYEALQAEALADSKRQEAAIANMLDQSIEAFALADYQKSMEYADQALRRDPRNAQAIEIRDAAFRAGREKVRSGYVSAKREQFARWQEQMDELLVPWTNIITNPDPEFWQDITDKRSRRRGFDLSEKVSPTDQALRDELRTRTVRLGTIEDEESLINVVGLVRTVTGLPLVVDPAAENTVVDEGIIFNLPLNNEVTVEQALNLITERAGEEVVWTVRHDAVLITTREKGRGDPIPVNHPVQDLIFSLTDFLGPRIDRIRLLDELEDDDGGGPFGGIGEAPRMIEIDSLVTLIQENVAPGSWEDEGISIEAYEGSILAVHTPEIQGEVRQFLEDLRRFSSSLVTIESKFMVVGSNWLQEIGVDFRGLDNIELTDVTNGLEDMSARGLDNNGSGSDGPDAAGSPSAGFFYDDGGDGDFRGRSENFFGAALGQVISNVGGLTTQLTFLNDLEISAILRAVEKSADFELINSQMLSVHNTQRAYVTVVNQQAYIQDFDVEVAQFQAVADPQVNVLMEGIVLDVRPTIHHDRKYLTLEVQPTVANVVALRPFSSSLGGNTSPVTFQLPEVEVQSVFTTAVVPDGGSILLGGLNRLRNVERRSEVPWLARIPIVGFFFKQEGYNDERNSLIILIRAQISDVREEMERIEQQF